MKRGDKRHKATSTFSTNRIYTPKGGNATRTGPATLYISDDWAPAALFLRSYSSTDKVDR